MNSIILPEAMNKSQGITGILILGVATSVTEEKL